MNKKIIGPILLSVLVLASCNLTKTSKKKPHGSSSSDTSLTTEESSSSGTSGSSSSSGGTTSSGSSSTSGSSSSSGTSSTSADPATPVVTSVTLSSHTESVKQGASVTLTATVTGKNNPSKTVTWTTSNSGVATVSNGVVSVKSGASVGATVKITATSTVTPSVSDYCTITVLSASTSESYTILIYMCGSSLENDYAYQDEGLASSDLLEMMDVANQPSNVNIVVETGGSPKWSKTPGISASKNERRYLRNGQFVVDSSTTHTKANMGLSSTLSSFLSYGLTKYPADHTGVIMWNHGGAVSGCCTDDNYGGDGIIASEFDAAMKSLNLGDKKLDWIGYDCCIMSYADLASINSQYFKYMVSSQELESGYGWDYDAWLPTLYNNTSVSTETLLTKICDTFVAENGGTSSNNDQCLSVLNLQSFSGFQTAFESFASGLKSTDWSKISSAYESSLRFADISDDDYYTIYGYGLCDAKDFLSEASSKGYSTSAASTALDSILVHSAYGGFYNSVKPCGLNIFVPADEDYPQISKSDYGSSDTKLSNWRNFVVANGTFYGGGW